MAARWLILVCCFICLVFSENSEISDKRLCADQKCEVTISACRANQRHVSTHKDMLAFTEGDEILVKSKDSGSRPELWGGELNGKRGYFPKYLVTETKVFETDLKYTVPTTLHAESDDTTGDDHLNEDSPKDVEEDDPTDLDDGDYGKLEDSDDFEIPSDPLDQDKSLDANNSEDAALTDEQTDFNDDQGTQDIQTDMKTEDKNPNLAESGGHQENISSSLAPESNPEALEKQRRIAKQEQLQQLRNNFLRRRTAPNQHDAEVDELNDLLKAAYSGKEVVGEFDKQEDNDSELNDGDGEDTNDNDEDPEEDETDNEDGISDAGDEEDETGEDTNENEDYKDEYIDSSEQAEVETSQDSSLEEQASDDDKSETVIADTETDVDANNHDKETSDRVKNYKSDDVNVFEEAEPVANDEKEPINKTIKQSTENTANETEMDLESADEDPTELEKLDADAGDGSEKSEDSEKEQMGEGEKDSKETDEKLSKDENIEDTDSTEHDMTDDETIYGNDGTITILADGTTILEGPEGEVSLVPQSTVDLNVKETPLAIEATSTLGVPPAKTMLHHEDDNPLDQIQATPVREWQMQATASGVASGELGDSTGSDDYPTEDEVSHKPSEMAETGSSLSGDSLDGQKHEMPDLRTEMSEMERISSGDFEKQKALTDNDVADSSSLDVNGKKLESGIHVEPGHPEEPHRKDVEELGWKETTQLTSTSSSILLWIDYFISFFDPLLKIVVNTLPDSVHSLLRHEPLGLEPHRALISLVFSIGMLAFITALQCRGRRAGKKLADIASVMHKLDLVTTEREELREKLDAANAKLLEYSNRSAISSSEVEEIRRNLVSSQQHAAALQQELAEKDNQLEQLQQSIVDSSRLIETKDAEICDFQLKVTQMTEYTARIENQLTELQSALSHSQVSLLEAQSQIQTQAEELTTLQQLKDQLQLDAQKWTEQEKSLQNQLQEMEELVKKYQDMVSFKENEIEVWKDCFKQLKSFEDMAENDEEEETEGADGEGGQVMSKKFEKMLQSMVDVASVNAKLKVLEEEKRTLFEKLTIETESRKEVEGEIQELRQAAQLAKEAQHQAEKKEQEATMKLNILQSYFQEKELEMQKELGEQQARQKDKLIELESADVKSKMIAAEMEALRSQVEDLKKDIEKSEQAHRKEIATHERRAHENWLVARQAEREKKEALNEAATLRMKLLEMDEKRHMESTMLPLPMRGLMNGPHRSSAPLKPGPIVSPGPPFIVSDRPPSHTGPLPALPDDRPPSLTSHPRPLSDIPRDGSPLDRDRVLPIDPRPPQKVPYVPAERPFPPDIRGHLPPPPHLMERERLPRPPLHPMDRNSAPPPDFRHPADIRGPPPFSFPDRKPSPPGSYRHSPPLQFPHGPPPPGGPGGPMGPPPMGLPPPMGPPPLGIPSQLDRRGLPPPPAGREPPLSDSTFGKGHIRKSMNN